MLYSYFVIWCFLTCCGIVILDIMFIMLKVFYACLIFVGFSISLLAGGLPEVRESEQESLVGDFDEVFEAVFVSLNKKILINGKEHIGAVGDVSKKKVTINYDVTLATTRVIKGGLSKHQFYRISIEDMLGSDCPHINEIGDFRAKQVYFIKEKGGKRIYRYRTIRENLLVRDMSNRYKLVGQLGERLGKELLIVVKRHAVDGNDPFGPEHEFEVVFVDGKRYASSMNIVLEASFKAKGGKLRDVGKTTTYRGYEALGVQILDNNELLDIELNHPRFLKRIFETQFFVTGVVE